VARYDQIFTFLDATLRIRYDRLKERWDKSWESEMSYEQFLSDENLESEKENNAIRELADIVIENNSTKEALFRKIETYIKNHA
jgi:dephospho-CoA kinase